MSFKHTHTGKVLQTPHPDRLITGRRGKCLFGWRELDGPNTALMAAARRQCIERSGWLRVFARRRIVQPEDLDRAVLGARDKEAIVGRNVNGVDVLLVDLECDER